MFRGETKSIIYELAKIQKYDLPDVVFPFSSDDGVPKNSIEEVVQELNHTAAIYKMIFMQHAVSTRLFNKLAKDPEIPFVVFSKKDDLLVPLIFHKKDNKPAIISLPDSENQLPVSKISEYELLKNEKEEIYIVTGTPMPGLLEDRIDDHKHVDPVKRLLQLLSLEKKHILYIYIYAAIMGLISLSLPLGIQAIVGLVAGGMMLNSVFLLITFVVLGVFITGMLQVFQISIVEILQRKVFSRAAFEFAFRIPKLKAEGIQHNYLPELINRFFDVITIQKGMPKLLIDFSSAALQILFGLILLSLYHPFFVFFGITLIAFLYLIFYFTGSKGLSTSITESKYKYSVVYWLEELGRTLHSFKLAGSTSLPISKTDLNVNNYLKYRKMHFGVLMNQYSYVVVFKTLITAALLIMGVLLVSDRQITLGQFVASEIIIILILNSVEKIIMHLDVIYDMLTAVDKIGFVTDLPLERAGGMTFEKKRNNGLEVHVKDLKYKYKSSDQYAIEGVDMEISSGEKVAISGYNDSGKSTLINIIGGIYNDYQGIVTLDNLSLRELDLEHVRNNIGQNFSQEEIFEGTILENVTLGKPATNYHEAIDMLNKLGLMDEINKLTDGLSTKLLSGGKRLSSTSINKLILARCLVKKPRLLIINDFFQNFSQTDKKLLMNILFDSANRHTLLVVTNDPLLLKACDRIYIMKEGKIDASGSFETLMKEKNSSLIDLIIGN